jgi:adenosine deaminase
MFVILNHITMTLYIIILLNLMDSEIKQNINLFNSCYSLPKTELHAHLNGSIRHKTLFELSEPQNQEALSHLFSKHMDFNNAFEVFKLSSKIVTSLEIVARITREMLEDWNSHNCIYLEIRTTLKQVREASKEDYLRTVLTEIKKGNEKLNMGTRLIISLNRESSIDDYMDTYNTYVNFNDSELKKLVVGVDLCGFEGNDKNDLGEVFKVLNKFRDLGLGITIHSGEVENYKSIDFNVFRPDRISHTYYYSEEDFAQVRALNIPVEVCPTSSYFIKRLSKFEDIPFKNYHNQEDYNLFCINTDDTMLIQSDLSQEYYEIASNFKMTVEDLKNMLLRSIDFIFEKDEEVRERLREKIRSFN